MRKYSSIISFTKNSRGVYSLDPSIGCTSGILQNKRGCFGDCYAKRIANIYGYDFDETVFRYFESDKQRQQIINKIRKIKMPFIRMGTMGDPSENWDLTLSIISDIQEYDKNLLFQEHKKEVVIITKHWNLLTDLQLQKLKTLKVCINTSISAIDDESQLITNIGQYELLKNYCRSILRLVSFDFNKQNEKGLYYHSIQENILKNFNVLDTVFRPTKNNYLLTDGIINAKKSKFLGKNAYLSKHNKKTYIGKCDTCLEMCGVNM